AGRHQPLHRTALPRRTGAAGADRATPSLWRHRPARAPLSDRVGRELRPCPGSTLRSDVSSEGTDFEGLTQAPGSSAGKRAPGQPPAERRQRARVISAGVLGAVVTAFALLNLD